MMLLNILPSTTSENIADRRRGDVVRRRQTSNTLSKSSACANVPDGIAGEFGSVMPIPAVAASFADHVVHVVLLSPQRQVRRVAAGRVIADNVSDDHPIWNLPDIDDVRRSVCKPKPCSSKFPVAVTVPNVRPQPARAIVWSISHDPFEFFLRSARVPAAIQRITGLLPSTVVRTAPPTCQMSLLTAINAAPSHRTTLPERSNH